MKQTQCKLCGAPFICDNGMWSTTCTCAKDRPVELATVQRPDGTTPLHGLPLNEDGEIVFSERRTDGKRKYQENHGKYRNLTPEEAQAAYDAAIPVPLSEERLQEIVAYATASPGPQSREEARQFHEGFLAGATAYANAVGHSTLKSDNQKLCEVFDMQGWRTTETFEKVQEQVNANEKRAVQLRVESRNGDGKPEGTRKSLERCARMLDTHGADCFPANEHGQVHFARAMMESVADEIREFLDPAFVACEHGVKDGDWCEPCNKEMKRAEREQLEGYNCSAGFCGGMGDNTARSLICACCGEPSTTPGQFVKDGRWVCTEECRKNLPNVDSYDDLRASGGIVDAP